MLPKRYTSFKLDNGRSIGGLTIKIISNSNAMTACTIYFVYYFGILASQIRGIGINETIEKRRNALIYPIIVAWRLISPVAAPSPSVELISKFPVAHGMVNTFANSDSGMLNSTLLMKVD